MAWEHELSLPELQREVWRVWDKIAAMERDFRDLPEVPSYGTMITLSHGGFPFFWEIGKQEQIRLWGSDEWSVPSKTECEVGMGRWKFIRDALRAAKAIEARRAATLGAVHESAVAESHSPKE